MFRITESIIDAGDATGLNDKAGAYVVFEGRVRNHNEGQPVEALEYEAYGELAEKEGEKILEEARRKFAILEATAIHRVGKLAINDIAVRVEVAAAHRKDAFLACEFIIDEVKRRVPIWKKEHYESGVTGWINCHTEAASAEQEAAYYARQIALPEVGVDGQQLLRQSRVLVVGAGGLGSPALLYLAAAGIGTLGVADGDLVSISNLHRQVLYRAADVGRPKAEVAAERLQALNPHITATVHGEIDDRNAEQIFRQYDLVIDGTDNFRTKFLLNDAAVLTGIPLIQASIYQYEGQLLTVDTAAGGPCLRCTWPETPAEGCVGNCAEAGVLGAVPGVFGSLQATEALKRLLCLPVEIDQMVIIDLLGHEITKIRRKKNPSCPACGEGAELSLVSRQGWEADPSADLSVFRVVDIREDEEREADLLPNAVAMPLSHFGVEKFDPGRPYLLVCARGVRSSRLAKQLHQQGWTNFLSLPGGAPVVQRLAGK